MCYDIDADAVKKATQFRTKFAFLTDTCSQNISSSWLKQLSRPAASCYFMSTSANNYYAKKSVKATADSCPDSCPVGRKIARASMYNAHQCSGRGLLHVHLYSGLATIIRTKSS